jgi:pSer/pThr/pTyr-binding forkhead associated (FHA) protein
VPALQTVDGKRFRLLANVETLGRDPANSIILTDDPKVSRAHAEIRVRDAQRILIDLESRNGTRVNNRRVSSHPLRDGDRIRLGDTTLIFAADSDEDLTEAGTDASDTDPQLSERERQVLTLVAAGLTDQVIADTLLIAVSTVRSHLDRIRGKTGLRRRSELTRLAVRLGLVD